MANYVKFLSFSVWLIFICNWFDLIADWLFRFRSGFGLRLQNAGICFNHPPPVNRLQDGGRKRLRRAGRSPGPRDWAVRSGQQARTLQAQLALTHRIKSLHPQSPDRQRVQHRPPPPRWAVRDDRRHIVDKVEIRHLRMPFPKTKTEDVVSSSLPGLKKEVSEWLTS